MKARKIVICFDGTGNEVGDFQTNIIKLYNALRCDDDQITHYVPGVGTFDEPRLFDWKWRQKARSVAGLAFGLGLEDDVLDAYRFLCRTYKSTAQKNRDWSYEQGLKKQLGVPGKATRPEAQKDHIYIFGFSRGAYAARILAGFIHNFGLIEPDKLHLVTGAFRAYRAVTDHERDLPHSVTFRQLRRYEDTLKPDQSVPIRALCLFDTVSSMVGFERPLHSLVTNYSPMELRVHANVLSNPSVRIVLHALAVDERRSMFRPLLWEQREPYFGNRFRHDSMKRQQYVRQRWFPGYHSDIGGSPRERESGIGKLTLLWMLDELERQEIAADREDRTKAPPDPDRSLPLPPPGLKLNPKRRKVHFEGANPKASALDGTPYARPDAMAEIHDSMSVWWYPLEILPKSIKRRRWPGRLPVFWKWYLPLEEPRFIPEDHEIDGSVTERMARWPFYRPQNLRVKWPDDP
jgi:uncharacterized protein (DUF2235 family)